MNSESDSEGRPKTKAPKTDLQAWHHIRMRGDNLDERRIASPEMFLGVELLPHLICSRQAWRGGDRDEAGEHGDKE
jgi:hypothetical protein